jgi:hypothetical protein
MTKLNNITDKLRPKDAINFITYAQFRSFLKTMNNVQIAYIAICCYNDNLFYETEIFDSIIHQIFD